MRYVVLLAWLIQSSVGVSLLVSWWREGGRGSAIVVTHVGAGLLGLALWVGFLGTGSVVPAWLAWAVITIGNGFGEVMLLGRSRTKTGPRSLRKDYAATIAAALRGELPPRVVFHALFSGVVYFTCLGVCVSATIANTV